MPSVSPARTKMIEQVKLTCAAIVVPPGVKARKKREAYRDKEVRTTCDRALIGMLRDAGGEMPLTDWLIDTTSDEAQTTPTRSLYNHVITGEKTKQRHVFPDDAPWPSSRTAPAGFYLLAAGFNIDDPIENVLAQRFWLLVGNAITRLVDPSSLTMFKPHHRNLLLMYATATDPSAPPLPS